jgi:dipeptidyl aminopeptidase/acylaminoacyl peptidase
MRRVAACLTFVCSALASLGLPGPPVRAEVPADGTILERRPYAFAAYDSVPSLVRLFPREEYDEAVGDQRFRMERVVYASGGLKVVAYAYSPARRPSEPPPVIVFNRGGYVRGDIGAELAPMFRRLALAGFAVVAPLYRGSDGGEGRDEMGGADLADLMNVRPLVVRLGIADTTRFYLYGESRGGTMVFQALRDGFRARAAAVFGAFTDFDSLVASDPDRYARVCPAIWPDFAQRREEIATRRSALRWAERLGAPLLLLHGGADGDVDPALTLRLAERLQRLGREYELHVYAGDGHALKRNRADRDERVADWFRRHEPARGE